MIKKYKGFGNPPESDPNVHPLYAEVKEDPQSVIEELSSTVDFETGNPYPSDIEAIKKIAKVDESYQESWYKHDKATRDLFEWDAKGTIGAYTNLLQYMASPAYQPADYDQAQRAINTAQYRIIRAELELQRYQKDTFIRIGLGVLAVGASAFAINALLLSPLLIGPYIEGKMSKKERK